MRFGARDIGTALAALMIAAHGGVAMASGVDGATSDATSDTADDRVAPSSASDAAMNGDADASDALVDDAAALEAADTVTVDATIDAIASATQATEPTYTP